MQLFLWEENQRTRRKDFRQSFDKLFPSHERSDVRYQDYNPSVIVQRLIKFRRQMNIVYPNFNLKSSSLQKLKI